MKPNEAVTRLIDALRNPDDGVRGPAWQGAGVFGASAVRALVELMDQGEAEAARAARRALERVTHHAGRPHANSERHDVERELLGALPGRSEGVSRAILWMLSMVGDAETVKRLEPLLGNGELREDVRCALQRIPGRRATATLRRALGESTGEFAEALAESLRARGEVVEGPPSRKRTPRKGTAVGIS